MRSVVDFYRQRPAVAVVVVAFGLAVAIVTAMLQDGGGLILPIAFTAFVGLAVGSVLAIAQRRRDDADPDR